MRIVTSIFIVFDFVPYEKCDVCGKMKHAVFSTSPEPKAECDLILIKAAPGLYGILKMTSYCLQTIEEEVLLHRPILVKYSICFASIACHCLSSRLFLLNLHQRHNAAKTIRVPHDSLVLAL